MLDRDIPDHIVLILMGILVILAPAVILGLTLEFLVLTGDLVLGRVTLVELLELYLIDLVAVSVVAYLVYRLGQRLVHHGSAVTDPARDEDADGDDGEDSRER
ncbi:hypothetical protein [Halosimplex marinum]|uniref:hypothetical protein n=1 Tax=Halosimplex marinum TaxID=3396620 RepID=UPI003F57EA1B